MKLYISYFGDLLIIASSPKQITHHRQLLRAIRFYGVVVVYGYQGYDPAI